jgi:hypothetical protein
MCNFLRQRGIKKRAQLISVLASNGFRDHFDQRVLAAFSSRYGYQVGINGRFYAVVRTNWICRKCAGLSYASEGGALRINFGAIGLWGCYENHPRPKLWLPWVFTNLAAAMFPAAFPRQ